MTPTAADEMEWCRQTFADARTCAAIPVPLVAAREAYVACLHAANAYVLERTGDVARTHKGVHFVFRQLCLTLGEIDVCHAEFFQAAYRIKENNDYGDRTAVTAETLPLIMQSAADMIQAIQTVLERPRP